MPSSFIVTGRNLVLEDFLKRGIEESNSLAVGVAVAYVSIYGVNFLRNISTIRRIQDIRLVADIGDSITHPQALRFALGAGWQVRVVNPRSGTFHPKLIIGGVRFAQNDLLQGTRFSLIGSANLTKRGLNSNIECSLLRVSENDLTAPAQGFRVLWRIGVELTEQRLEEYEREFAERNRQRPVKDLEVLGVADETAVAEIETGTLRHRKAPQNRERSIATTSNAMAAWAGLESFTGDYDLQVEFPRYAGEVLRRIIASVTSSERADMLCEDGITRSMLYGYYRQNSMFRLNVPNETPDVDWVRENRRGIALVLATPSSRTPLSFRIIRPGADVDDIIGRSIALGTWGKTTTRLYGWF